MSTPSSPACVESPPFLVIPAGGRGLRMGGDHPKQFRNWGGIPLLLATIQAFFGEGMPRLRGIALAVPADRLQDVRTWDLGVPLWVTLGGETRQASVEAALALLPEELDVPVMIHDAVRPFPPAGSIKEALANLDHWDGTLLGEVSTDTLKRVASNGQVLGTEARDHIFRAQTPQIARLGTWRRAFSWARDNQFVGTDDASILEAMGLRVRLVPAPGSNIKLTTPEDWLRWAPQGVAVESTNETMGTRSKHTNQKI